jgi:hypothetical protein
MSKIPCEGIKIPDADSIVGPDDLPLGLVTDADMQAAIDTAIEGVGGGGAWGEITGSLSAQTDLQSALDAKLATATAASTYQPLDSDLTAIAALTTSLVSGSLVFKIDTTTTGAKSLFFRVPYACTITAWELVGNVSGSVVLDIWKDTYANFPPVVADSITASAKPTLSAAQKAQSSTLTGWTTALAAGDYIEVNVDSVTSITNGTLALTVTRT